MTKYILILLLPILLVKCNKNDDDSSNNPLSQLPPATQTGENRAGCLINGEAYLPKGGGIIANLTCSYEFVNSEYFFSLIIDNSENNKFKTLEVFSNKIKITEGQIYNLNVDRVNDPLFPSIVGGGGFYFESEGVTGPSNEYTTNDMISGELTITKLDEQNSILSGTFWFDAVDADGKIIEVREGRFDTEYIN